MKLIYIINSLKILKYINNLQLSRKKLVSVKHPFLKNEQQTKYCKNPFLMAIKMGKK